MAGPVRFIASVKYALVSPIKLLAMPRRAWLYFGLYLTLCAALLGVVAWQLGVHRTDLENVLLDYLLPESWQYPATALFEHFFASQHRVVLVNALVVTALMAVTLTLFPVKEAVSASFERGRALVDDPIEEHPLWEQGWQEIKLVLIVLAVQLSIFWIGYFPSAACKAIAVVLGYLLVCFSFAVDFVSPVFQRHRGYYSQILKTLGRHAVPSLLFGAIFSAPTLIVAALWSANESWSWTTALLLLFGVQVVCIAWAAASGTWLGAKLFPSYRASERSYLITRVIGTVVVIAVLAVNGVVFGSIGLSVHHKSQILKCDYDVDVSSFGMDGPSLGSLLDNRVAVAMHIDLTITNPTPFDVELEPNEIVIEHRGKRVATSQLAPIAVKSGESARQTLRFSIEARATMLAEGRDLLEPDYWQMTMYIQVNRYVRLPIYLLRASSQR